MGSDNPFAERLKELNKKKRRLLDKMRRQRKALARSKAEKKGLNDEIRHLKAQTNLFGGMTKEKAFEKVSSEIRSIKPEDAFPKDLEREFDTIERTTGDGRSTMEVETVLVKAPLVDDSGLYEMEVDEDGVVDLSEEGDDG